MPSWSAVHTRWNFEGRVDTDLGVLALEHYSPTYPVERKYFSRNVRLLQVPIFPGYVFASLNSDDLAERDRVLAIRGACGIIPGVTDLEIANVRLLLSHGGLPVPAELIDLPPGARIRMKSGPLLGVEGEFKEYGGRGHLIVLVEILGRGVATEVSMIDAEVTKRGRLRIGRARVVLV